MHFVCLLLFLMPSVPFMDLQRLRGLVPKITLLHYSLPCNDKIFPFPRIRGTSFQALSSPRTSQPLKLRHWKVRTLWFRGMGQRTGERKREVVFSKMLVKVFYLERYYDFIVIPERKNNQVLNKRQGYAGFLLLHHVSDHLGTFKEMQAWIYWSWTHANPMT